MQKLSPRLILVTATMLVAIFLIINYENVLVVNKQITKCFEKNEQQGGGHLVNSDRVKSISRDFYRYKCKSLKRIGGAPWSLKKSLHDLYRVEGSWYICLDEGVAPIIDRCVILSFGINQDESFDRGMNTYYGCQVESFDPFVEHQIFQNVRSRSESFKNAVSLEIEKKWRFHKMGIVGINSVKNINKMGWMATFDDILKYTGLTNKVIDIVKVDTEGSEWDSILSMDVEYLCKYVKQFMLETHPINWQVKPGITAYHLSILRKLEKCFSLFHRDTRFYAEPDKTEFQQPITYKVDLNQFSNELDLIDFMIVFGELYFVNENFLSTNNAN